VLIVAKTFKYITDSTVQTGACGTVRKSGCLVLLNYTNYNWLLNWQLILLKLISYVKPFLNHV